MSGPKVVRIVTREELLAKAVDEIASVENAIRKFESLSRRHDIDISGQLAVYNRAVTELKALAQVGAWEIINRRCTDEIFRIEHSHKVLDERLLVAATKDQSDRRRLKDAAKAIRRESLALDLQPPYKIEDVIANVDKADPDQLKRMDGAVAEALSELAKNTKTNNLGGGATAKRLATGLKIENYSDWLANHAAGNESHKLARLDKILAELRHYDIDMTESTAATVRRIQASDGSERDLLIDSLTIELSNFLTFQRQHTDDVARLKERATQVERVNSQAARDLLQKILVSNSSDRSVNVPGLLQDADELLKTANANDNSAHRRKALLAGLTELGYEMREGMATALVQNGRLVLKKPKDADYGVEIIGGTMDGRMQVRMVRFTNESNALRDKDVETIWCGEFSKLQASLAQAGHALKIEKALAAGAAPMKISVDDESHIIDDVKNPRSRSI